MRKRILILCSLIGLLLVGFRSDIYAEEDTPDISSSTSIITSAALDQYFYDNYELLPYIESSGSQYINTGYNGSSDLKVDLSISNINSNVVFYFWGNSESTSYGVAYYPNYNEGRFVFYSDGQHSNIMDKSLYSITYLSFDKNNAYVNNELIYSFPEIDFNTDSLNIFGKNNQFLGSFKLYRFSIYDYSINDGEGGLVRDYYPARSKASGIIGLYDAVNKTFVTTSGSVPFDSPTGDATALSLGANITQFLSGSLSWIGAIFEGINEMPIIWVFIAIGLVGVMFRWGRRLVHF